MEVLSKVTREEILRNTTKEELDLIKEKIVLLYKNYGIDIDEMGDDEFGRLIKQYLHGISDIDKDFSDSSQHSDKFSEDDLI